MNTVNQISDIRAHVKRWKQQGLTVAFVPTMGNLHEGHLTLVDNAFKHADKVIVSIFVNPMQFGENEDLDAYPRTLKDDSDALIARGVNLLYTPKANDIYPRALSDQTFVEVPHLGNVICGETRPAHFRGVTTIVNKLFNIVQPDIACFGEKDFQQLYLIKRMVDDLSMPIDIIGVPTVREDTGLAMSSRNGYLTAEEKSNATVLYKSLQYAKHEIEQGQRAFNDLKLTLQKNIDAVGLTTNYIHFYNAETLQPATENTQHFVILVAAYAGKARLIDNIHFSV